MECCCPLSTTLQDKCVHAIVCFVFFGCTVQFSMMIEGSELSQFASVFTVGGQSVGWTWAQAFWLAGYLIDNCMHTGSVTVLSFHTSKMPLKNDFQQGASLNSALPIHFVCK